MLPPIRFPIGGGWGLRRSRTRRSCRRIRRGIRRIPICLVVAYRLESMRGVGRSGV